MHNGGGPNGCSQPRTLNYFVKELMRVKCHDELQQDRGEGHQQMSAETTTSPLTTAAVSTSSHIVSPLAMSSGLAQAGKK